MHQFLMMKAISCTSIIAEDSLFIYEYYIMYQLNKISSKPFFL